MRGDICANGGLTSSYPIQRTKNSSKIISVIICDCFLHFLATVLVKLFFEVLYAVKQNSIVKIVGYVTIDNI